MSPTGEPFVPNQGANTVTEYSPPYTGTPTTIAGGQNQPVALAIDAAGNLYVANYGNNTVTNTRRPSGGSWTTLANGVQQSAWRWRSRRRPTRHRHYPLLSQLSRADEQRVAFERQRRPLTRRNSPRSSAVESGVET